MGTQIAFATTPTPTSYLPTPLTQELPLLLTLQDS